MKTRKLFLIFLCLVVISIAVNGQVRQCGLILPVDNLWRYPEAGLYFPKEGLKIYDSPNGKETGILIIKEYTLHYIDNSSKTSISKGRKNCREIDYEIDAPLYFERRDGFVRIMDEFVNYWVSEQELASKNFRVLDWQQFFIQGGTRGQKQETWTMCFPNRRKRLYLKAAPTNESKTLRILTDFEMTLTTECKGKWLKVKVREYKECPCTSDLPDHKNFKFKAEGWIEILDENDQPTVWYPTRGC